MEFIEEMTRPDNESLSGAKQDDMFFKLISGKDLIESIDTSRGIFKVRYPKQKDLISIARRKAFLRGGLPAGSFDENSDYVMQKIAFLDVVVTGGELWFENLKKKNSNFTWGDMPDDELVDELYVKAWAFREKVQEQLRHNEGKTDTGAADRKDVQETVGDDFFSGIAGTAEKSE